MVSKYNKTDRHIFHDVNPITRRWSWKSNFPLGRNFLSIEFWSLWKLCCKLFVSFFFGIFVHHHHEICVCVSLCFFLEENWTLHWLPLNYDPFCASSNYNRVKNDPYRLHSNLLASRLQWRSLLFFRKLAKIATFAIQI